MLQDYTRRKHIKPGRVVVRRGKGKEVIGMGLRLEILKFACNLDMKVALNYCH